MKQTPTMSDAPHEKEKIIVILGPTASGKTALGIELARACDGEIISADSRQVYRDLDIGTEKVSAEERAIIPHHCIDIADPKNTYTAANFAHDAANAITDVRTRGKTPIIAGGTFFYVDILLGKQPIANVPPNEALRAKLESQSTEELFSRLESSDPRRGATIDPDNKRRLIRALEIVEARGAVPEPTAHSPYTPFIVGIHTEPDELRARINARLETTLHKGLIDETRTLLKAGISRERLNEIGLEYRVVIRHLDGVLTHTEMVEELRTKLWQYAKRQRTWLKQYEDIQWYDRTEIDRVARDVTRFLRGSTSKEVS